MNRNFSKYLYPDVKQLNLKNKRLYETPEGARVPSVTTILSKTKDMTGLDRWVKAVGEEKAEKIRNEAAFVGTSMHEFLEEHREIRLYKIRLDDKGKDYLIDNKKKMLELFETIEQARLWCDLRLNDLGYKFIFSGGL